MRAVLLVAVLVALTRPALARVYVCGSIGGSSIRS